MALRYDASRLEKVQRTPAGYLRIDANVTKPGVFSYTGPDGKTRREWRPPEEVFKADSIASLKDATVTDLHPPVRVDAKNAREYAVGHQSGEPKQTDQGIGTMLVINDAEEIKRIDSKDRQEVSCGYDMREDHTSGFTPDGEAYDLVQRDIVYNHIALGPKGWGRQGSSVALRLDSNGDQEKYVEEKKKIKMKVRVDGLDLEAGSAEHLQAQASLDLKRDTKIAELEAAAAKQVAKIDSLTAELAAKDVTIAEHKTRQDALEASQKKIARAGLEKEASKILGDKFKYDGLSDDAVRIEAIKKVSPSFKTDHLDTKTLPIYLAARFDGELEKLARTDGSSARIAERLEGGDKEEREDSEYVLDEKNPDPEAARENMKRQLDSAWMPKEKKTNEKRAY